MSFSLKLLGGAALASETGPVTGPAVQRHRLALLALLAASRSRAVSRDKLIGWLWPERETEPARRLLNQSVHALRQALGADAVLSVGEELQLNTGVLECDVVDFDESMMAGRLEHAVERYGGPFLDGFFLDEAPEFERWVDRERERLAGAYGRALEALAEAAEQGQAWSAAMERWKERAGHDPYDSRIALRLMEAMERAGNRAGALQHALVHEQLLRQELAIEPPPEIRAHVERLRRLPASAMAVSRDDAPLGVGGPTAAPPSDLSPEIPPLAVLATRAGYRRPLWYAAAVVLLAAGIGGAYGVAARSDDREPAVTPAVADEIAVAVARELERRRRGDTAVRLPRHRTNSIPAYELYLRGDDPALIRSDSGAHRALDYFRQAVALDSSYAAAWVGLARMTYRASPRNPSARMRAEVQAESTLNRALALDDSLPEAHALMGVIRARQYDWDAAERHFRLALSLEPTRRVHEWFAQFLIMTGRPAEALTQAERASALDPMAPSATAELARALAANGRCEEALARLTSIESLNPPLLRAPGIAARCYVRLGRREEAIALMRRGVDRNGDDLTRAALGYLLARAGNREEALGIHAGLQERWRSDSIGALALVYVPAGLDDRDQAFAWIDSSLKDGSLRFAPGLWADLSDAPFEALADDPRMARLRERFQFKSDSARRTGAGTPTRPGR